MRKTQPPVMIEQGLRQVETGKYMFQLGDKCIPAELASGENKGVAPYICREYTQYSKDELLEHCEKYRNLLPGKTDVFFSYSLLPYVLEFAGEKSGVASAAFVLFVSGESASFKSKLTKVVTDIFMDSFGVVPFNKISKMESELKRRKGITTLFDDIYPVHTQYSKDRQNENLDEAARITEGWYGNLGAIITAEHMPDELNSSTRDRIFEVKIEFLMENEITRIYDAVESIPKDFMCAFMVRYLGILTSRTDEVTKEIQNFLNTYHEPDGITHHTRMAAHMRLLLLSEHIYRVFFCEDKRSVGREDVL